MVTGPPFCLWRAFKSLVSIIVLITFIFIFWGACMWRSENSSQESVLSLHLVTSRVQTQVVRFVYVQEPLPAEPLHQPHIETVFSLLSKEEGSLSGRQRRVWSGAQTWQLYFELLWVLLLCWEKYKNMGLTCTHVSAHTADLGASVVLDSHSVSSTESFTGVLDNLPIQPQSLTNRWGDRKNLDV